MIDMKPLWMRDIGRGGLPQLQLGEALPRRFQTERTRGEAIGTHLAQVAQCLLMWQLFSHDPSSRLIGWFLVGCLGFLALATSRQGSPWRLELDLDAARYRFARGWAGVVREGGFEDFLTLDVQGKVVGMDVFLRWKEDGRATPAFASMGSDGIAQKLLLERLGKAMGLPIPEDMQPRFRYEGAVS